MGDPQTGDLTAGVRDYSPRWGSAMRFALGGSVILLGISTVQLLLAARGLTWASDAALAHPARYLATTGLASFAFFFAVGLLLRPRRR